MTLPHGDLALPQGDLALLDSEVAQRLLAANIPARLAFTAYDGTPRVLPINFVFNGTEVVMCGFARSHKNRALRARPDVAITIDTNDAPPEVLLIRGRAEVTESQGLLAEYAEAMRKGSDPQVEGYLSDRERDQVVPRTRLHSSASWSRGRPRSSAGAGDSRRRPRVRATGRDSLVFAGAANGASRAVGDPVPSSPKTTSVRRSPFISCSPNATSSTSGGNDVDDEVMRAARQQDLATGRDTSKTQRRGSACRRSSRPRAAGLPRCVPRSESGARGRRARPRHRAAVGTRPRPRPHRSTFAKTDRVASPSPRDSRSGRRASARSRR